MSVNRYDASTGELTNIASGQRTWVGTQAAYKAAKQAGTLPNNAIIAITDDEVDHNHYSTDETVTGEYWIDGKPIYKRTVANISGPTAIGVAKDYQLTIQNVDKVIFCQGFINDTITTPHINSSGEYFVNINALTNSSGIIVRCIAVGIGSHSAMPSIPQYTATVYYTKTTD